MGFHVNLGECIAFGVCGGVPRFWKSSVSALSTPAQKQSVPGFFLVGAIFEFVGFRLLRI